MLVEKINNSKSLLKKNIINEKNIIQNLYELYEGEPLVHLEHGVGRYAGMIVLNTNDMITEYVIIKYADNDKLYVPVCSLHLIHRYINQSYDQVPLHKLGSCSWKRTKKKVIKHIKDIAVKLLDIYAKRTSGKGFSFYVDKKKYNIFCKGFPFKLTLDQTKTIKEILNDMNLSKSMDRLVCGDVSFGKTEIAMRAAFIAIENKKQVAILVPTTLLAKQHFNNFSERFSNFPTYIEMISRFKSINDQNLILKRTAEGKINILIGTHKILQHNVKWHDLGLLIIDEEHRFGVQHKEYIKSNWSNVDILTLTATPIPRTLNMAMIGMRDISIISTPPDNRLPVKTFVCKYDETIIRKAILKEILRKGQVYYLYNDVKYINKIAQRLQNLVPESHISIAHGKLKKKELNSVMNDFQNKVFNVLVCTTIIETGIDISNVNTIIIERADTFGLSKLYQLRGRVGRSNNQGYAYLLIPPLKILNKEVKKRLNSILLLQNLGSGFNVATQDLETRGSGKILGEEQSGQIENIGFYLYMELLNYAIDALKQGSELSLQYITNKLVNVELNIPTLLPDNYITNINTRLILYKRIAMSVTDNEIEAIRLELIKKFGVLPNSVNYLLKIAKIRNRAKYFGIKNIEVNDKGGFIEFNEFNFINPSYIVHLITTHTNIFFLHDKKLKFICNLTDYKIRIDYINCLLDKLQQHMVNKDNLNE